MFIHTVSEMAGSWRLSNSCLETTTDVPQNFSQNCRHYCTTGTVQDFSVAEFWHVKAKCSRSLWPSGQWVVGEPFCSWAYHLNGGAQYPLFSLPLTLNLQFIVKLVIQVPSHC